MAQTSANIDFTWEVKSVFGKVIIQQELTLEITATASRGDTEASFEIERIGFEGAWLETDTPIFKLISKAAENDSHVQEQVNDLFDWSWDRQTGTSHAYGLAA